MTAIFRLLFHCFLEKLSALDYVRLQMNLVIAMERSDRSNPIASRSPHYVRDDNPELARGSCHCEPCRKQGVAIFLQAALVFGLLRYARNDKNQDGREAQGLSP